MDDGPTWATLFERAAVFERDETAIRSTLRDVREGDGDGS